MDDLVRVASQDLVDSLARLGKTVATAESCTGGWIAKALTDIPGSSAVIGYGIVSYSNDAKSSLLGVSKDTLLSFGAVSEPVVKEMAAGVRQVSGADFSVAVSGIAGPDGGTDDKPVGTVWFAWDSGDSIVTDRQVFSGDRNDVRSSTVIHAISGIKARL